MTIKSLDRCECDCHNSQWDVSHIMACCGDCPYCGKQRICTFALTQHLKECQANINHHRQPRRNKKR